MVSMEQFALIVPVGTRILETNTKAAFHQSVLLHNVLVLVK
jgi:hypothetical protein